MKKTMLAVACLCTLGLAAGTAQASISALDTLDSLVITYGASGVSITDQSNQPSNFTDSFMGINTTGINDMVLELEYKNATDFGETWQVNAGGIIQNLEREKLTLEFDNDNGKWTELFNTIITNGSFSFTLFEQTLDWGESMILTKATLYGDTKSGTFGGPQTPLPAAAVLLFSGLFGLAGIRRFTD